MSHIPPQMGSLPPWMNLVARYVNPLLKGYLFPQYTAAPADPQEGFSYYDLTLKKVRTWDGSAWQAHW